MTNPSIDALKNEIADCYIKNFQKELGWLKGMVILPIKSGMKDILTGKAELPEKFVEIENFKFWKNIIQFLSVDLANKIFDFLKTKRQEIISRQTVSELLELKKEVLGIDSSNQESQENVNDPENENNRREENSNEHDEENKESGNISSGVAGVSASAVGTYGTYKFKKLAERRDIEKVVKNLDDEQIKGTIESAIDTMKKQKEALKSRLTPHQRQTVEKHIAQLQDGLDEMKKGNVSDLLKDWYAVREHLPGELLKNSFDEKILKKIDRLANQFRGKSVDEIKAILGITDSDESLDSLLKCISEAEGPKQIKQMTKVIRGGNRLSKFAKTFAGAMRLDVAFAGLDVWMYMESEKEAELISKINKARGENKHNQAVFQLRTGLGSVVAEGAIIMGICAGGGSYGGPIGTLVGVVVGAAAWGISEAGDALYYDVADFYLQNDEDFLRQSRGKIKQAILQGIHNYKKGNTSINEKFTTWIKSHSISWDYKFPLYKLNEEELNNWSNAKQLSLKSACRSMIFLEEIEDGTDELKNNRYLLDYISSPDSKEEFLKDKDEEYKKYFNEYREKMAARIDKRMEYVEKEFEKDEIIDSIYAGAGVQRLTQIFTESKGYANMSDNNRRNNSKTYSENIQSYKKYLFKDFPAEKLEKLELIRKNNPSLFLDIITTTSLSAFIGEGEETVRTDENYRLNVELVETYKKYMNMFENLEDKHYLRIDNEYRNGNFIHNLLKADFNIDRVEYPAMSSDNLLNIVGLGLERKGVTEISDNILQNILYRLAKQLNGYTGMNDMYELMKFYGEDEDDVHGIYYSDKRKINDDRAIDSRLNNNIPKILHESDIDKYVNIFMKSNFYTPIYDDNGNVVGYNQKSSIDTPTESIDSQLTTELINIIEGIVRDELKNHTVENQEKIKEQIKNIVKQNSNGEFIELPYYLILEAKKAGLGDLQKQFFRRNQNDNVIEICYMNKEYNTTAIFDNCEKLYISAARNEFTKEEKSYIDRVDSVCEKLKQIKSVEGWGITQSDRHEDDLDLPIEIEHIISDKIIEREKFKETILLYDANTCNTAAVIRKYSEYAEYFETLYRGILFSEAGFTASNDLDTFQYFQSAMGSGSMNLFTDKGEINIDVIKSSGGKGFDFLLNDNEFISFYQKLYKNLQFKIDNEKAEESLEYRRKQGDAHQKELARRVSYDIITTTFEKCLLQTNGQGDVVSISHGTMGRRKTLKDDIESEVKKHISKMKIHSDIDISKITPLMHEKEIKKLSEGEKQVTNLNQIIEELIKENLPQVDWSDRRLQLQYDAEDSSINSWGEKTKISIEEQENNSGEKTFSIRISGLDIEFTELKEGIRTANLLNWLKYNMKKEPIGKKVNNRPHPDANLDKYKRESGSLVREVKNDLNDIEILKEDILDTWFPTIKDSNEFLRFINELLEIISSDNGGFQNNDERRNILGKEPRTEEAPITD